MPGQRRGVGQAVAPRPVLELLKEPLFDAQGIATAATQATFFAVPQGQADATAPAATKTATETNMVKAGAVPTPQLMDIYGLTVSYQSGNLTLDDLQDFHNLGNIRIFIGTKEYLRVPLNCIPSGVQITGLADSAPAAREHYTSGLQSHQNIFDVTIPEELLDQESQRVYLTGRRVPIHLPSEQNFQVSIELATAITLTNTVRTWCYLWGIRKREVQ